MPSAPQKVEQSDSVELGRAKPIPRRYAHLPRSRQATIARVAAIASTTLVGAGVSDLAAARTLGVDGSTVREFRTGKRDISLARVMQLPAPVRREILRRAEDAMQAEAPMSVVDAQQHVGHLIDGLAELAKAIGARDKPRILAAVRALIRRAEALESDTERAIAKDAAKEQGR